MKSARLLACIAATLLPFTLSGCIAIFRTRKLPIPKAPANIETVAPPQLVEQLNERWEKLQTLVATVEIETSVEKTEQGVARDYTTFPANILLRKPGMMRVLGRMPIVHSTMFDMWTNGESFTIYVPSKNKAIKGLNAMKKKSANQLENLRPEFFYDAMVVRGLDSDDNYSVTADTETVEDPSKKHLLLMPEYVVNITRSKPNSREQTPVRVITLNRVNLQPIQQDLYDSDGNLATHVTYSNYRDFGFGPYPGTITIKRPLENFELVLAVEKVTQNMPLNDDQFVGKVPPETQVQHLQ
jgi:outer membrane lipoprotein-sorting protein